MKLEYFLLFSLFFTKSFTLPTLSERDQSSESKNSQSAEEANISKIDSKKEEQGNYLFIHLLKLMIQLVSNFLEDRLSSFSSTFKRATNDIKLRDFKRLDADAYSTLKLLPN
jgi:hypothetical protein